jgi:hypothetical protein
LQADFDGVEGVFERFAEGAGKLGKVSWEGGHAVSGRMEGEKAEAHTEP